MPSAAPRSNTSKKEVQLRQRQQELKHLLHSVAPKEKLLKAAEKLRLAHLSLLKARLHWALEAEIHRSAGRRPTKAVGDIADIDSEIRTWTERPVETIIADHQSI